MILMSFVLSGLQCADDMGDFVKNDDAKKLLDFSQANLGEGQSPLVSYDYTYMASKGVKENEEAIEERAQRFKDNFFPGKQQLDALDRREGLTQLFNIAYDLDLNPAIDAIVELRTPKSLSIKYLQGVTDIPDDLRSLMLDRLKQREYIEYSKGNYSVMIRSMKGKDWSERVNEKAPLWYAKKLATEKFYPNEETILVYREKNLESLLSQSVSEVPVESEVKRGVGKVHFLRLLKKHTQEIGKQIKAAKH